MEDEDFMGPSDLDRKDNDGAPRNDEHSRQQISIAWTVAYYLILVVGAVGFYKQLFPLTESNYALPVVLREE